MDPLDNNNRSHLTQKGRAGALPAVALLQASLLEPLPAGPASAGPLRLSSPGAPLYGRPLRVLGGRPVLCQMIDRLRQARTVGQVVVALSVAPEDDALATLARGARAAVFRGSVHDLCGRLAGCAEWLGLGDAQPVVRVLADTPLVDPRYLDAGLRALSASGAGALEFIEEQSEEVAAGLSAGFLRAGTLRHVDRRARTPVHRADVMRYVYEYPQEADLIRVPLPESLSYLLSNHRVLLHTAEDLVVHEALYLRLYRGAPVDTAAALSCLDADPVLASLNRGVLRTGATRPLFSAGWRGR